jgi:hypothetical protein
LTSVCLLHAYVEALSTSYIPNMGTPPDKRELSQLVYDSITQKFTFMMEDQIHSIAICGSLILFLKSGPGCTFLL